MLFESKKPVTIPSKDADIFYYPCFFNTKKADKIFKTLRRQTKWQQASELFVQNKMGPLKNNLV